GNRFNQALHEIEGHFAAYRISDALMATYKLVWDDFCAWYLELAKPAYQQPIAREVFETAKTFFESVLRLIHPFMPFISEELWHDELFGTRADGDCCIVAEYPQAGGYDEQQLADFVAVQQVISEIRNLRNTKQLSPKTALPLAIHATPDINFAPCADSI